MKKCSKSLRDMHGVAGDRIEEGKKKGQYRVYEVEEEVLLPRVEWSRGDEKWRRGILGYGNKI